ncbi:MAG: hypothetical protein Q8P05_02625 [Candidatus Diapherotrites archaeon]|nr:hypothetical protein [Candidatus Diapherotrites archaeon]MDZ4256226.1 hypothetical protein [archaeon]
MTTRSEKGRVGVFQMRKMDNNIRKKDDTIMGLLALGMLALLMGGSAAAAGIEVFSSAPAISETGLVTLPYEKKIDSHNETDAEANVKWQTDDDVEKTISIRAESDNEWNPNTRLASDVTADIRTNGFTVSSERITHEVGVYSKAHTGVAVASRVEARERLLGDVDNAPAKEKQEFKIAARALRSNIRQFVENDITLGGSYNGFFGGDIFPTVMATPFTITQKLELLQGLFMGMENENYSRHTFMAWSINQDFIAMGKMGGTIENGIFSGLGYGWHNGNSQVMKLFLGNGFIAGLQGTNVFWGTYDAEGNFTLVNLGGNAQQTITGTFTLY